MNRNMHFSDNPEAAIATFPNGVYTPKADLARLTRVMDGNQGGEMHHIHDPNLAQTYSDGLPVSSQYGPFCDPPYENAG